ncbi:LmeA family phospholipid-binding protein [Phormidesmis sp. 146-33]
MEFLTIVLSSLIGLVSPTGLIVDRLAEKSIRSQFVSVEQLKVRVDNAPSYQILNGKVDRVRVAGRGLFPVKEVRIEALELETDPIALQRRGRRFKLAEPIQAGVRLVLKPDDINRALRSPTVTARLRNLGIGFLRRSEAQQAERYDLVNPQVTFLPNQRIRLQVELQEQGYPEKLAIVAEAEPQIISGRSLRLENLTLLANGQPAPKQIVGAIARVFDRFDLRQLEKSQITARVLKLQITPTQLQLAAFVQVRPDPKK